MVTRFSDQYSLAIVYQELLTGQRPFSGSSIRQLIVQHLRDAPNVSPLPLADQSVIKRALAKVPEQRFPTCCEMVQLLRANSALTVMAAVDDQQAPALECTRPDARRRFWKRA
jgi:serine/threonine protein kinase